MSKIQNGITIILSKVYYAFKGVPSIIVVLFMSIYYIINNIPKLYVAIKYSYASNNGPELFDIFDIEITKNNIIILLLLVTCYLLSSVLDIIFNGQYKLTCLDKKLSHIVIKLFCKINNDRIISANNFVRLLIDIYIMNVLLFFPIGSSDIRMHLIEFLTTYMMLPYLLTYTLIFIPTELINNFWLLPIMMLYQCNIFYDMSFQYLERCQIKGNISTKGNL